MGVEDLFGELYLRTTKPFLAERVTQAEVAFLAARLPRGRRLDLGCGHGRHARHLGPAIGLDADPSSLHEARAFAPVVRGSFFALPFRDGAFGSAYAWYNTLGTFEPEEVGPILRELTRCLSPHGVVVLHGTHPGRVRASPRAAFEARLPDGSYLEERASWSTERSRDEVDRRLTLPDGRVMAASFFIRYYEVETWREHLEGAGLELDWACGGVDGSPLGDDSLEVIVGAHKRG